MWKNKIKRRSNVEVEKFEDCIKVSIDKDTDKSKLKKIVDDHLLDTLDSTLNHGEYYYYKFGDGSALYVLLNNITKMFFNKNGEVSSLTINDASAYYIFSYKGSRTEASSHRAAGTCTAKVRCFAARLCWRARRKLSRAFHFR